MPPSQWQLTGDYDHLFDHGVDLIAREYLERNHDFHDERRKLDRAKSPTAKRLIAYARKWGLPHAKSGQPDGRWDSSAYPGALVLMALASGSLIGAPIALSRECDAATLRGTYVAQIDPTLVAGQGLAAIVPLDAVVDVRLAALASFVDTARDKPTKPFPPKLSRARQTRLILGLRALDGHLAGASYREIAIALFGADAVAARQWKNHDLRDKTIRLVRDARALMEGGYKQLLLHPHRRRIDF